MKSPINFTHTVSLEKYRIFFILITISLWFSYSLSKNTTLTTEYNQEIIEVSLVCISILFTLITIFLFFIKGKWSYSIVDNNIIIEKPYFKKINSTKINISSISEIKNELIVTRIGAARAYKIVLKNNKEIPLPIQLEGLVNDLLDERKKG